jgi:hypothetical protein
VKPHGFERTIKMLARYYLLGAACAAVLSGCGSSSYSSQYGSTSVSTGSTSGSSGGAANPTGFTGGASGVNGTHDSVVATPPSQVVSVEVGTTKTVSVTLTSNDGRAITGFAISNATGEVLPAGWAAPAMFGCKSLSTGSGCVLNLTFTPTIYEVGQSLTLHYVYVDDAMEPVTTDSMSLAYQATSNDNVTPTLAPIGQIVATVNAGSQTVTATFATDDGHPASVLAVTSDGTLPAGWSAPSPSTCATVSAGTTCQLSWAYTPTAPDNGTVTVDYSFNDDSGTMKTASFIIPYAATANDNVVGAVSPVAPISVAAGFAQPVLVTFTTDDGFQATNLSMDLSTLPTGWTATATPFTCSTISTGTACQATLTYCPPASGDNSTLQLNYGYSDNAGVAKSGSVNIAYTSS